MQPYNEIILDASPLNIKIGFRTKSGGYYPLHWHDELELLYPLNGESDIMVEGVTHHQKNKELLVVESRRIHRAYHYGGSAMFLCIHLIKESLAWYFPKITNHEIYCYPDMITNETFPDYLKLCGYLKRITELYINDSPTFQLEAEGLILQTVADLIQNFSTDNVPLAGDADKLAINRIRSILAYVEEHYAQAVSLQDAADLLGVGKEYFCRYFKKNMGTSFLRYVNEVRAAHIYQDLIHTDEPVQVLMEKNGFTNQKLFNRVFKSLYGCTPSQIRKS